MIIYYKLTDENGQTYGGIQWGPGVRHVAKGDGWEFCSEDLIHLYSHPLLAVLLNPLHADFSNPRLWEAEGEGKVKSDCGLKLGAKAVTTLREIPLPQITTLQKARFAILCALEVYSEASFVSWANKWLSGEDRTAWAAAKATWAARATAKAARAAEAARAARVAARAAWVAEAAWAAARAAWAATWAARATWAIKKIDLIALAEKAMEEEGA